MHLGTVAKECEATKICSRRIMCYSDQVMTFQYEKIEKHLAQNCTKYFSYVGSGFNTSNLV